MDDPTRRSPPLPDAQAAPAAHASGAIVQVHTTPQIPSLPGMPPIPPMPMQPGVSVHVQNIVGPAQMAVPVAYPYAAPVAPAPAPVGTQSRGVVAMMKEDASQKAMEAVSRRGPARVLAYSVGFVMFA